MTQESTFGSFGFLTLLAAQFMLIVRIWVKRDCSGISGKTQELYAIVFLARNLDIFSSECTLTLDSYILKIIFIIVSYGLVISIFFFHWESYQARYDTFRIELLVVPCLVLSFLANYGIDFRDIFWAFSVYLECVAIIPQIYMISRAKRTENIVFRYIALLALYKIIHMMDIIHEQFYLNKYYCDRISLAAGTVQLLFYFDFFLQEEPDIVLEQSSSSIKRDEESGNSPPKRRLAGGGSHNEQSDGTGCSGVILSPTVLVVHSEKP